MSQRSLDSRSPLMDRNSAPKRASVRYSTYSTSPSFTSTTSQTSATSTERAGMQEIRQLTTGLQRLDNQQLTSQRVVLNEEQTENMKKLALGAKLERALGRRMVNQDYVMREGKSDRRRDKRMDVISEKSVKT